jgi:hypothetical protein
MEISVKTKYNVGDVVYIADCYYDFYANHEPYVVKDVIIDINTHRTRIQYEVEQKYTSYRVSEAMTFSTYAQCAKWCNEHN